MLEFNTFFDAVFLERVFQSLLDSRYDFIKQCSRICTGSDRIDLNLFLSQKELHIGAISRKVIDNRYTFNAFLEHEIPKPDSDQPRTISIASIRDTIVQKALYRYLYPVIDDKLTDSVFGYRSKRSAHHAIHRVQQQILQKRTFIFDADIVKFFDELNHSVLIAMLEKLPIDARAITLVRRFLKADRVEVSETQRHKSLGSKQESYKTTRREKGVPQGGVLSGLLSNFYLHEFDQAIRRNFSGYVRYADDFLVCCLNAEECKNAHSLAKEKLRSLLLDLHPEGKKTQECVPTELGVNFLGFRLSEKGVTIRRRNVVVFKSRIRNVVAKFEKRRSAKGSLRALIRRIAFKVRGPSEKDLELRRQSGRPIVSCRRSWIGYFRIVDDFSLLKGLDRWLRDQISKFMWEQHAFRARHKIMKEFGLPSLVNTLWRARKTQIPDAGYDVDQQF